MQVRKPADHLIQQRRVEEDRRRNFSGLVKNEQNDRRLADWETATGAKIATRKKLEHMDRIQAQHAQTLEERRGRLAQLLAAEQEQYERAIEGMVETQDQRRERMAQKALELRTQREAARQAAAADKQDRSFQTGCDVLRDAISRNATLQVAVDRAAQIELNDRKKKREAEDERFFDEMWEAERLKKVQRAQQELEERRKLNAELKANLSAQTAAYQAARARDADVKAEEDRIYKEQIQLQLDMDAKRERDRRAERVALGHRNKEFNLALRKQKEEAARREKEEDIQLLDELLRKLQSDEEADQISKREARIEAQRYLDALREQMGQDAENEAELERLWALENEKEWAKREAQWKIDQDGRDNLLREVFEERRLQLELKRQNVEDVKKQHAIDRARMLDEMEALAQIETERNHQRKQLAVDQREELQQQMAERDAQRQREQRDKILERRAAEVMEDQFRAKVQAQLDKVESKKPAQYRNKLVARPTF